MPATQLNLGFSIQASTAIKDQQYTEVIHDLVSRPLNYAGVRYAGVRLFSQGFGHLTADVKIICETFTERKNIVNLFV